MQPVKEFQVISQKYFSSTLASQNNTKFRGVKNSKRLSSALSFLHVFTSTFKKTC